MSESPRTPPKWILVADDDPVHPRTVGQRVDSRRCRALLWKAASAWPPAAVTALGADTELVREPARLQPNSILRRGGKRHEMQSLGERGCHLRIGGVGGDAPGLSLCTGSAGSRIGDRQSWARLSGSKAEAAE